MAGRVIGVIELVGERQTCTYRSRLAVVVLDHFY